LVVAILFGALAASAGHAERKGKLGTVRGTVSGPGGVALSGVAVKLVSADDSRAEATTDELGKFSLKVPAGEYVIGMEKEGFAPLEASLAVEAGGRHEVEVELVDAATGRRNEAIQAYNAAGDAFEAGDRAAAKAGFLAAAEADPSLPEPHRVLAEIYYGEGAWAEAAAAAERFLAARPGDRQGQLLAYNAYRKLGGRGRIDELRRTLGRDPELAAKLAKHAFNEGAIADQQEDAETAAARFGEALELDAGLTAAHFALATVDYRRERYTEALAGVEKGLALEPASAQGRRLLFLVQYALGDLEAAAEAIEAYAEVDTAGAAELLFKRADLDFRNGERDAARKALLRVIELEPGRARAHYMLGLVFLTTDTALAKKHLLRFVELAPEDAEAEGVEEILAALE
jgi:tetratricopeptide (TPR) repeat protein